MEVRTGYKLTDVGVIPEGWDVKVMGSITSLMTNGFVGTATSAYVGSDDGVLYIQGYNVQENGFNFHGIKRVSRSFHARNLKSCLQSGDLLTIQTGDIGVTTVVPPELAGANCHALVISRLDKRVSEPHFYCQYFNSERGRAHFKEIETGSTMKHLNVGDMKLLLLPSPPVEEQRAIATALSDVDALLCGLDRLIAKKRDLKQAAMQQLLTGQARLPGFHGEWEVKRLGDVVQIKKGQLITSSTLKLGDIPVIAGGKQPAYFHASANRFGRTVTISASGASAGYVALYDQPVFASDCSTISESESYCLDFVFYQLLCKQQTIYKAQTGGAQPHIHAKDLNPILLSFPSLPEQTAIAEVLTEVNAELTALEQRREKTRALKQAMMQELLTGKTRLVEASSNVVSVDFTAPPGRSATKPHNWQINEAVVVAVLVKHFGSEQFPLGRKRCAKLSYLLHRHVEHVAEGYLKKAAGPYNPSVKYKGPEAIAQKNGYVRVHKNGTYSGLVAAAKIGQAEDYFDQWYGREVLGWLEQFRRKTNDELELLTTVDLAAVELERAGKQVRLEAVKSVIGTHPEWEAKLEREIFSDANIARAIRAVSELFLDE